MDTESRRTWARALREGALVGIVFSGIYWIFFGKFLKGDYSVANFQDNTHFILPLFAHISRTLAGGGFPYWINSIVGGIPLYNTPQFSLLYPLYLFGWNLYRTPLDTSIYVHYVTLLHVGILWVNTYVMMRVFHLHIISSALGSTLFAFSANTYAYLFWVNIISPYSWLPLCLASVFLILENQYPKAGLVLGWLSTYLLVSASPAQPLIHFAFCSGVLVVAYAIVHRRAWEKLIGPLRNIFLLVVGSLIISSPVLIPSTLFAQRDMMRWTSAGAVVGNQKLPFEALTEGQTTISGLAKVLFPLQISQVLGDSYFGVVPVLLVLFAVFRSKQDWIVIPLFCVAIYTLLSSTGSSLGLIYVNYFIPLWNKIREPARHLYLFGLAASTLAAFGFEYVISPKRFSKFDLRSVGLVSGLFAVLLVASWRVRQGYATLISDSILIWSLGLFLALLLAWRFLPKTYGLNQVTLAAITVCPMLWYPPPILKVQDNDYFAVENLRSHRVLQEVAKIADAGNYRLIVTDDALDAQYWSMNAIYYRLRTFSAFMNPLPSTQTLEMFAAPSAPRYAQLLGGKYYLNCHNPRSAPDGYLLEREIEGCSLYSTKTAQPYYFLSTEVGAYSTVKEFFDGIDGGSAQQGRVLVPSEDMRQVSGWLGAANGPLNSSVFREQRSMNSLDLGVKTDRKSLLVLNEYFRKDWQVTVNGKSQKLFKVNLNQIGVFLPEGTSDVHFEYRPLLFLALLHIQRAAFVMLAVGVIAMAKSSLSK